MRLRILLFLSLCTIFIQNSFSQEIKDIIDPISLIAGQTDSVYLNDLFYSKSYDCSIQKSTDIKVTNRNNYLYLTANKSFEGFTTIKFSLNNFSYELPIYVNKLQKQLFKYKPAGNPKQVNLFGSFNSWNRQDIPMLDKNKDGVYEAEINIEPGIYQYKFFVDGKELVDNANPEKVSNGMGDYNSIVTVKPLHNENVYLHQSGFKDNNGKYSFSFYFEDGKDKKLSVKDVFVFLNNHLIASRDLIVKDNTIQVNINKAKLSEKDCIRLLVSKNGLVSNLQTIYLENKKPANVADNDWHNSIIYSLMVDRFNDGDKSNDIKVVHPQLTEQANYHGGDIQGIINKLNDGYFDSLHINTIWITPVVDNTDSAYMESPAPHRYYTGYHGYWPVHPTNIEEKFGTLQLFKDFVSLAHKHNIKILLDFVAHHVHIEHPYWKEHRDWFGTLDLPDGKKNLRLWDEYRLTTWFEPYMPSFDYTKSKEALETMTDNAIWWLKETGIDGFRHDAVKHVPNVFWRRLTQKIKEQIEIPFHKKVYQIGETFGSFELIKSYINNGQLDAQFNFNLYDASVPVFSDDNMTFSALNNTLIKSFSIYGVNNLMGNIIDSHDKNRFMAYADGDLSGNVDANEIAWTNPPKVDNLSSYSKLKNFFSFLMTAPGLPIVYYGDEFGMTGAADPDNRRMMRFDDSLSSIEKSTLKDVEKIINVRRNSDALNFGDFLTLQADNNLYIYVRSYLNERVLVIINKNASAKDVEVKLPEFYNDKIAVNLINNNTYKIKDSILKLKVDGISSQILNLK